MTGWGRWREVGDRVFVRRHRELDVNAGLVLGAERCLVVDTRSTAAEGRDLLAAVRSVTALPYAVVTTHAHFDHCFGNSVFAARQDGCEIWGHELCRDELARNGEQQRAEMVAWLRGAGELTLADGVREAEIVPPNRTFTGSAVLPLGGREVELRHLGRGHTDHDVVATVDGVVFAGDLVEQGAPPAFDDAFPLEWPETLDRLLALSGSRVVPGHGDVVDPSFVVAQRADLQEVADTARGLDRGADDPAVERAANRLAVGGPAGFTALRRALAHRPA